MWWDGPVIGPSPKTVPGYIGVIVTTQVAKQGSEVTGNIAKRVILKVEKPSAYRPIWASWLGADEGGDP